MKLEKKRLVFLVRGIKILFMLFCSSVARMKEKEIGKKEAYYISGTGNLNSHHAILLLCCYDEEKGNWKKGLIYPVREI
jgi:hypothetical protein